jgi:hypothetical protein
MGVDHRGADIAVAKHLLNLADVVVRLQQKRGARVPKGVWRNPRGHACLAGRRLESPLDTGLHAHGHVWTRVASRRVRRGAGKNHEHRQSCRGLVPLRHTPCHLLPRTPGGEILAALGPWHLRTLTEFRCEHLSEQPSQGVERRLWRRG